MTQRYIAPDARAALVGQDGVATPQFHRYLSGIAAISEVAQYFFTGTGTPEGNVVASPPAVFFRQDGGASTVLYVKETGTDTNTGWVAK